MLAEVYVYLSLSYSLVDGRCRPHVQNILKFFGQGQCRRSGAPMIMQPVLMTTHICILAHLSQRVSTSRRTSSRSFVDLRLYRLRYLHHLPKSQSHRAKIKPWSKLRLKRPLPMPLLLRQQCRTVLAKGRDKMAK